MFSVSHSLRALVRSVLGEKLALVVVQQSSNGHRVEKNSVFDLCLNETELSSLPRLPDRTMSCGLICKQDGIIVSDQSFSFKL